jgi:hypothetical protein
MGDRCSTCDEWVYDRSRHICPPKWLLWVPENGETEEDAREVYASDAEGAVEKWAEADDRDSADYSIARGADVTVMLRYADKPERMPRFLPEGVITMGVYGEYEPVYHASIRPSHPISPVRSGE